MGLDRAKKTLNAVSLWLAAGIILTACSTHSPQPPRDIVETAQGNGSLKTLVAAVSASGLVETLKGGGPFTVFAPTDEAFSNLPAGTVEELLNPENKDKLRSILTYHVVQGTVTARELSRKMSVKTVNGRMVTSGYSNRPLMVQGAKVIQRDIVCSNGIIHVIDAVLTPS